MTETPGPVEEVQPEPEHEEYDNSTAEDLSKPDFDAEETEEVV